MRTGTPAIFSSVRVAGYNASHCLLAPNAHLSVPARRSASDKALAEALVAKLEPVVLSFTRKSGEAGHLFGSVTSVDIAAGLEAKGFEIDRRKIQLEEPLKSLGDFKVAIKLYREVTAHVTVTVLAEASEETAGEVPAPVAEAAPAAETAIAE